MPKSKTKEPKQTKKKKLSKDELKKPAGGAWGSPPRTSRRMPRSTRR